MWTDLAVGIVIGGLPRKWFPVVANIINPDCAGLRRPPDLAHFVIRGVLLHGGAVNQFTFFCLVAMVIL